MTPSLVVALLLAVAVVAGGARLLWRFVATPVDARPRTWRLTLRIVVPILSALLLHRVLFPPPLPVEGGTLVVRTADADAARRPVHAAGEHVVTLPEATSARDAERVPDLGTALRRYPATRRMRVLGAGLTARDRDAARGHALEFLPAPLPRGLVELHVPRHVRAGRGFTVAGRAHDLAGGSVELLDPSEAVVASSPLDAAGTFRLSGAARSAGRTVWRVRLRDAAKTVADTAEVPVVTDPGVALRILVLAGAPNPELKYLRRWASDAGFTMDTRISLGAGMTLGSASTSLDPETLAKYDVLLLDQRAWTSLGSARRSQLDRALRDGLGLVLQLTGPLPNADRQTLRGFGFDTATARAANVRPALPGHGSGDADTGTESNARTALALAPLRLSGKRSAPFVRDTKGMTLAAWQARGRGRVVVSLLGDSYRWVLAGRPQAHAELWNTLLSAAARASGAPELQRDDDARAGERTMICGVSAAAAVIAPDGRRSALHVDPAAGPQSCAAFWPRSAGWHTVRSDKQATVLFVRATSEAPGLLAADLRDATRRLAAASPAGSASGSPSADTATLPGPRWPWFLAWLAISAAMWWFERSRLRTQRRVMPASVS